MRKDFLPDLDGFMATSSSSIISSSSSSSSSFTTSSSSSSDSCGPRWFTSVCLRIHRAKRWARKPVSLHSAASSFDSRPLLRQCQVRVAESNTTKASEINGSEARSGRSLERIKLVSVSRLESRFSAGRTNFDQSEDCDKQTKRFKSCALGQVRLFF